MVYHPSIHHRRSIRLKNYDYSQSGAYFVTTCVQNRQCIFGDVNDAVMHLNTLGHLVEQVWEEISAHFCNVDLDAAIVMPNHFHGILMLVDSPNNQTIGQSQMPEDTIWQSKKPTLGQVVGYFKYQTTKRINKIRNMSGEKVWQRNYYEIIIRDRNSLARIRHYIENNPKKWNQDQLHPFVSSK